MTVSVSTNVVVPSKSVSVPGSTVPVSISVPCPSDADFALVLGRITKLETGAGDELARIVKLEQDDILAKARLDKLELAIIPPIVVPPPVPYDPQIKWKAGMETGSLSEWEDQQLSGSAISSVVQTSAEGIPARTPWVMKQSVTGVGGSRMYNYSTINSLYRTGNPLYYSFWAYFPQVTSLSSGGFFNLLQIQSINPSRITDPVWILGFHPANFTLRLEWWGNLVMAGPHAGESGGHAYDQPVPIPVGKWTFIEVMVVPREDFSGAVKVWQDGTLLFDMSSVKTKYPESNVAAGVQSFHISKNAYGQNMTPLPNNHYVDDVTISLGRLL